MVQGLVGTGVGVALIPELALAHVRADVAIRELSPRSPVRRVTVATPTDALTPAAEAMLGILQEAAVRYAAQRTSAGPGRGRGRARPRLTRQRPGSRLPGRRRSCPARSVVYVTGAASGNPDPPVAPSVGTSAG